MDKGLAVMEVNFEKEKKRITKYGHFLNSKSVKDVIELDKNLILVLTFIQAEFFIIDLGTKEVTGLGPAFGSLGLCMK